MNVFFQIAPSFFYILGALSALAGAYGTLVFPDVLTRMHGATKPQVFGLFCMCTGFAIQQRSIHIALAMALVWGLQLLTIPVGAHIVARAAHRTEDFNHELTPVDEMTPLYTKDLPTQTVQEQ
ncbi:MAG: monovalent cation/H(+) antiporter subunit G [Micrococcaceae bacterium]